MEKNIKYWIELSDYDLTTAVAMQKTKRYLYVGFMCHQTIEKAFKALFSKNKSEIAPFSHSLSFIATKGDFYEEFTEDQKDFIDQVEPLNIEARYPSHKERILKGLSNEYCKELLTKTKEIQKWIKTRL